MYIKSVTVFVNMEYANYWATEIVNAFLFVKDSFCHFELKDIGFEIHPVYYAKYNSSILSRMTQQLYLE